MANRKDLPDEEQIDENSERALRRSSTVLDEINFRLRPNFIGMSISPPAAPANDSVPLEPTQRQTYGPVMPTVQLDPGLHPQDYLDRMRRGQSTDADNAAD